jgi:hypothetical protein
MTVVPEATPSSPSAHVSPKASESGIVSPPGISSDTLRARLPPKTWNSAQNAPAEAVCFQLGLQGETQMGTHWPFEHVVPDPQEQEPPQPSPPHVPGAHDGVQQVWLARHKAPPEQEQEPPQPSPPHVPGAHDGVQQVWLARHKAPPEQEQEPPQPSLPHVPGAHDGVQQV